MGNLLSAGLYRLLRNKLFYVGLGIMALLQVYLLENKKDAVLAGDLGLESSFFSFPMALTIGIAAFSGLFLGSEYSSGSLRNRLTVGYRKHTVYFANLALSTTVSLAFSLAATAVGLCYGYLRVASFHLSVDQVAWYLICSLGVAVTSASLSTLISMNLSHWAVGIVVSVVLAFVLLFAAQFVMELMAAPKMIPHTTRIEDISGRVYYKIDWDKPKMANPMYLEGPLRSAVVFLWDFLPACQCFQLAFLQITRPVLLVGYSALFTLLTTGAGLALFQHKDIK